MRLVGSSRSFRHCAGVLGWPLEHTLSPLIHSAAFRSMDMDWTYYAWPVQPDLLEDAVRGLRALGAAGANVTMPHKETVIGFLDAVVGDASATAAVNTIQNLGGRLVGHNTDVHGFRSLLMEDIGLQPSGARALVLGSGGAARAVVKALTDGGATVAVAVRRPEAGEALKEIVDVEIVSWDDAAEAGSRAELIVNCTPLGMKGEDPLPALDFGSAHTVVDLVYSPPITPMIERARSAGADAWGGLGMLVHQAAASFEIWTGREPPLQAMSAAAIHAVGRAGH